MMKSIVKRTQGFIFVLLLAISLLSGADYVNANQTEGTTTTEVSVAPTKISFDQAKITLTVGDSKRLVVLTEPANMKLEHLQFVSSNENYVYVNKTTGAIKALKAGQVTIKATDLDSNLQATCTIVVKEKTKLNKTNATINIGGKAKVTVIGADKAVKWSTANSKIATVKGGIVSGTGVGTTKIYATVGTTKLACTITVRKPTISKSKLNIYRGKSAKLSVKNVSKTVTWSSANQKVATVSKNGTVQGVGIGKTTITAKINANYSVKCSVEVKRITPAYSISLPSKTDTNCTYIFMYVGNTGTKPLTIYAKDVFMNDSTYREYDRYLTLVDPYSYKSKSSETIEPGEAKYLGFRVEGDATYYDSKTVIYYTMKYDGKLYRCYSSRYHGSVFGI